MGRERRCCASSAALRLPTQLNGTMPRIGVSRLVSIQSQSENWISVGNISSSSTPGGAIHDFFKFKHSMSECVYVRREITSPGRQDLDKVMDGHAALSTHIPVDEHISEQVSFSC